MSRFIWVPSRKTLCRKCQSALDCDVVTETRSDTVFTFDNDQVTQKETITVKCSKPTVTPSDLPDHFGEWQPTESHGEPIPLPDMAVTSNIDDDLDDDSVDGGFRRAGQSAGVKKWQTEQPWDPMHQWKTTSMSLWSDLLFTHHAYKACQSCLSSVMNIHPLHVIHRWTGTFWAADSLLKVGLVYQLGHSGQICPFPSKSSKLIIVDSSGVHELVVCQCSCRLSASRTFSEALLRHGWYPATVVNPKTVVTLRCLELYRSLCVVGNVNVHNFICLLEYYTSPGGHVWISDCYTSFMHVVRQVNFLQHCRRAGRFHDSGGIHSTKRGQVAVLCWACPREGVNLPPGWETVDPEYRFLYMLLLAMDANFRLKSCLRKNSRGTVDLGDGWGFFIPSQTYREFISQVTDDDDISNCVAFAVLAMANMKFSKSLRASGVGRVFCSRHGVPRPNGIRDLQKGERYSNMDFIFWSSIVSVNLLLMLLSYDVGCQYRKSFHKRKTGLPSYLNTLRTITFLICLPVWHGGVHNVECQAEHIITHVVGAGATDGEEPEREWALSNPFAYFTREMGEFARLNFLEDKWDYLAYQKNIQLISSLAKKLYIAIREHKIQDDNFTLLSTEVISQVPHEWESMVFGMGVRGRACEGFPKPLLASKSSFDQTLGPQSVAEVAVSLSREELAEVQRTALIASSVSMSGMLLQAVKIWTTQQHIYNSENESDLNLNERHLALLKRIKALRKLQATFSPASLQCNETAASHLQASGLPDPVPEMLSLWLPSNMPTNVRRSGCASGLAQMEVKLQTARVWDKLDKVRSALNAKAQVVRFRDRNVSGQKECTRAAKLIERLSQKVDLAQEAYNDAVRCVEQLGGEKMRVMSLADVSINVEATEDARSCRLVNIAVSGSQAPHREPSKTRTVSWIWECQYGRDGDLDSSNISEYMHVEWTKARRRRNLWREEVLLLREEMQCTLRSLSHAVDSWKCWGEGAETKSFEEDGTARSRADDILAGLKAYASKQQAHYQGIFDEFDSIWRGNVTIGKGEDGLPLILPAQP
ncbi:hypothetical protein DL96DRAFT_1743418 [Flagelloscypha sp. PMI_526]|nr:hypothetical protein DL96DRAFT_1743418 [Flagelloscypha sp. PMI_526]